MFLIVVCINNYVDLVNVLIKIGVDVNMIGKINILLLVVC